MDCSYHKLCDQLDYFYIFDYQEFFKFTGIKNSSYQTQSISKFTKTTGDQGVRQYFTRDVDFIWRIDFQNWNNLMAPPEGNNQVSIQVSISPDIHCNSVTSFLWHARGQNFCANFVPFAYKFRPYCWVSPNILVLLSY